MAANHHGMAQTAAESDVSELVASALKPFFERNDFPGISVAIVINGQVALAQGYGLSNVATRAPVAASTRFDIGSVTKTFTALGVLMLYQESQSTAHPLDLDAPIGDYLHNTASFKLPAKWSHITTRELLAMTSGIGELNSALPWQEQLQLLAKTPLLFAPGTETSYSDANFDLLGELIEQRTGEPYGTFIENQILTPLGMSQTQELGRSATVSNQAVGYSEPRHGTWLKASVQNGPAMFAAAGVVSTATDMAKYMTALLSGGLLDQSAYRLMWTSTPSPAYGVKPPAESSRGLGWDFVIDAGSGAAVAIKNGLVPGFTSDLVLYPTTDSGVFVSFNTSDVGGATAGFTATEVAAAAFQAALAGLGS